VRWKMNNEKVIKKMEEVGGKRRRKCRRGRKMT
jgi:hypothetical protein